MKKYLLVACLLITGCYNAAPQTAPSPPVIINNQPPVIQKVCPPQGCPPNNRPQINLQFEFEEHHDHHKGHE